jgi:hypothetical protein
MLAALLHADWKIVTRTGDTTLTEYFKGALQRCDSSPAYTTVLDFDRRRQFNWRTDLRQYQILEWPPETRLDASGPLIVIERATTDTGERKQFFGRTARHMVTRVTRAEAPETVIDAWYLAAPGLPLSKSGAGGSFAILTASPANQPFAPPRLEFRQTGPATEGLPVWQRVAFTLVGPDGARHTSEAITEVTELVQSPLPDSLFRPPEGYRQVTALPPIGNAPQGWAEHLQAHLRMFSAWFSRLFGNR